MMNKGTGTESIYARTLSGDDEFAPLRQENFVSLQSLCRDAADPIFVQIRHAETIPSADKGIDFRFCDNKMINIAKMYKANAETGLAKEE